MTIEDESRDRFPVGMRVLAVDDDPICLKLLETLLRRCDYHVTVTNQAVTALKLLRDNRNKFDLVISDVHMPDMDGFKLLELVGLEMDLPVIMLSANGETRAVMKGIAHGACDYLLKPVRIEELKNIWQHVIRKKKVDPKDRNNFDHGDDPEKVHHGTCEGGEGPNTTGPADRNGKLNRKRKDQNEDDEDEFDDNGNENEDPSAQKKPRVVWSVELHRKFVAAVNQLGIDEAVPKRILELMNVEKLTRENVASHLQKYRLYLKRISCVASQQANMVAALGGKDSYLPMGSLHGFGDCYNLTGSGQLQNNALVPFQGSGVFGRVNHPNGLGPRGLTSSGMIQLGRTNSSGNSFHDHGKLQRVTLPGNPHGNLHQGMPASLELDQLQQNKSISRLGEFSLPVEDSMVFPVSQRQQLAGADSGVTTTSTSGNPFISVSNNPLMLQEHQQQTQFRGLGNQSSVRGPAMNSDPFEIGFGMSSPLPDLDRCNDTWQNSAPLSGYSADPLPLPMGVSLTNNDLNHSNLRDNIETNPLDVSPISVLPDSLHDSVTKSDLQCQGSSNFGSIGNSIVQNMNYASKHRWEEPKQCYAHNPNLMFSSPLHSSVPNHGIRAPLGEYLQQNSTIGNRKMDTTSIGQLNYGAPPFPMQHCEIEKSSSDTLMKKKEDHLLEHAKLQGGLSPNNCSSIDDLVNAIIKRERDEVALMDGDIGCDVYSLGTCM
eukprot:TRINITY_DN5549_c0_g1_i4.p1 TRINITY_DN5549_c0_g1~~TRINITY_DN5549_c0_g1_i4.p1  ORF type:complete len:714 (+),score=129.41 TRINITY_DN5549_c0_g1_i4:131-2272(+)